MPAATSSEPGVSDYLVGTVLDEALASGQDVTVFWPLDNEDVRDWTQVEALWYVNLYIKSRTTRLTPDRKHILFTLLPLRRVQNESPVLLSMPRGLARDSYERACQLMFERFNVAGLSILLRPAAQMYAANAITGVAIDIDDALTDITPMYEGALLHSAAEIFPVGLEACIAYLASILPTNTSISGALAKLPEADQPAALLDLARRVWQDGHVRTPQAGDAPPPDEEGVTDIAAILVAGKEQAVIEAGQKRKTGARATAAEQARAKEIEALDLVVMRFGDEEVHVGKERHRLIEPLFDPSYLQYVEGYAHLSDTRPLHEVVEASIKVIDVDLRQYVWQGLFVTGDIVSGVKGTWPNIVSCPIHHLFVFKGLGPALCERCAPFLLSTDAGATQNEVQTRTAISLSVPEYFAEFRERGDTLASFLGASIVGKVEFIVVHSKTKLTHLSL